MRVFQKDDSPPFIPVTIVLETEEEYEMFKSHIQAVELSMLLETSYDTESTVKAKRVFDFGVELFRKLILTRKED